MTHCISFDELATTVFVVVDDWYQSVAPYYFKGKRGSKPRFSDSEVITLLLLMDFLPYPGETQYLGFVRANFLYLFPQLLDQSQFNRRARGLAIIVEKLRQHWATALGVHLAREFLLDTKPIPVLSYKRDKKRSDFLLTAEYGVCASRNLKYFGYKLVLLSTMDGVPVTYELVAANTDERVAANEVLDTIVNSDVYADKGFIGDFWQHDQLLCNGNRIWTPKRANQKFQNTKTFDIWLNSVRERIEGAFNELQNTGRNLERLLRKTVAGLTTHVIAKVTSHTLKLLLRRQYGIDVQTFEATG